MRKPVLLLCLVSLLGLLSACSSDSEVRRQQYLDADYYTRLELPPDLTRPDDSRALRVPRPGDKAMQRFHQETAALLPAEDGADQTAGLNTPVAAATRMPGAEFHSDANGSWLQVKGSVAQLWPQLESFWRRQGIPVKRSLQTLGVMETDWVVKLQISDDAGFFEKIFSNFEPDRVDRFTLQLQATGPETSRITVTHAGMEMVVEGEDSNWRGRPREPALEAEILKRLALHLGAGQAAVEPALLQQLPPFSSRVKSSDFHSNSFELVGGREHAMARLLAMLPQLGVRIKNRDTGAGRIEIEIEQLDAAQRGEQRDEYAEASWLMNLFRENAAGDKNLVLQLTGLQHTTRVDILKAGEPADSVLAEQLSASLKLQLR